jgi:hypothetical protein
LENLNIPTMKQKNLTVSPEIHQELKLEACRRKIKMQLAVAQAVALWLREREGKEASPQTGQWEGD